jgi:ATP diphosphatase
MEPVTAIAPLLEIMARLRDPERGCPWDVQQTFETVVPYTIEEAYEVADAIDRKDIGALKEELGDLLLQVVFHARMAEEAGQFDFADVVAGIVDKMVRRHPHVFGDASVEDAEAQTRAWEEHKRRERGGEDASALAGIARGMPEWQRALKLQKRAALVGFDWPDPLAVLEKLEEEVVEVRAELRTPDPDAARVTDEIGDLLFVVVNLARKAKVDVSAALRHANAKFERRFRAMEALAVQETVDFASLDLQAQEAYWQRVKRAD